MDYQEKKPLGGSATAEVARNEAVAEVKVVKGDEAYNEALLKEPFHLMRPTSILLLACTMLGFLCQTMNGYDGSLLNGLLANNTFKAYFHGSNDGIWAGLVSAMYQIGGVVALPFVGPCVDTWGRKYGMFIGAFCIVLGTIISGTTIHTHSLGQFMAGRFFLGFGVNICASAGPIYVVEASHPAFRGIATAFCNTFWFVGSILAGGAVRGALNLNGNIQWLLPLWLQIVCSGIICLFCWFIPESPRWLYTRGRQTEAIAVLTKYHGYGNPDSAWVQLQIREYEEFLNFDGADKRWWDYRALFRNRASVYRLACNCTFSIFGQWAGNGVLTYFLSAVLDTAGYTGEIQQTNINLGYACFQFVFALTGAAFVDRIGRRPLMLCSMAGCCITWIAITASTGIFANSDNTNSSAARATVAFIFIFGAVFSFGITPLQALYPVEVLSFEMRAKGMAFSGFSVSVAGLLNQFAWPVSLAKIGWHTYIIFIIWCAIQWAVFYFFLPETKNRTLEELDVIFADPRPVKASLQAHKIALDADKNIVNSEVL